MWSSAMRDHVEAARDAGLHLGFFGSDAVDGRIRFADKAEIDLEAGAEGTEDVCADADGG